MIHYPHHLGDYAKATSGFTMLEHGAYRLLLDSYYSTEKPLPAADVQSIAKAATPADRKALAKVLARKFVLRDDHYHNDRVEAEIAKYKGKSAAAANSAEIRWEKERAEREKRGSDKPAVGMRTHMPPQMRTEVQPQSESNADGSALAMLTKNHNPSASSSTVFETSQPLGASEAGLETPPPDPGKFRRVLAGLKTAKVVDTNDSSMIHRWIREGTIAQIERAITEASTEKNRKSEPLFLGFIDAILSRIMLVDQDARRAGEKRVEKTQDVLGEQREAAERAAPMPEHMKPRKFGEAATENAEDAES